MGTRGRLGSSYLARGDRRDGCKKMRGDTQMWERKQSVLMESSYVSL